MCGTFNTMNTTERLRMSIADKVLEVVDLGEGGALTRSDLQGVAEATARVIITEVALFALRNDYDLEDL